VGRTTYVGIIYSGLFSLVYLTPFFANKREIWKRIQIHICAIFYILKCTLRDGGKFFSSERAIKKVQ
jgi:hypothetical protein